MTSESQKTFWLHLFERQPDLKPPGYEETVRAMGYEAKPSPPPAPSVQEECTIEF